MEETVNTHATGMPRRKFLQVAGGVPLALSGSSLLALAACGGSSTSP
jgi:hypothetical protein